MSGNNLSGGALYIAWKFDTADGAPSASAAAERVWNRLSRGERLHLFRLRSRVFVNGEVRALLLPVAPLERIAAAINEPGANPVASRWVKTARECAVLAREIEAVPVNLGLAQRPEQWRLSSAAAD